MFSGVWPLPEPLPCHAPPCPHRYEDGKYLNKKNTFLDFVACAGVGVCVEGGGAGCAVCRWVWVRIGESGEEG